MANASPLVFHFHEIGNTAALTTALETAADDNYAAVSQELPRLGQAALRRHEPVIRQVALRAGDAAEATKLLSLFETRLAAREPVAQAAINGLARVYFDKRGTILSTTTDEYQRWQIPGTNFSLLATTARSISLEAQATAQTSAMALPNQG